MFIASDGPCWSTEKDEPEKIVKYWDDLTEFIRGFRVDENVVLSDLNLNENG